MKKIINDPFAVVDEMLEGIILAHPDKLKLVGEDKRAVIRADTSVQHGRVIRTLDLLKQAGISKIAFGVTPVPAAATRRGDNVAGGFAWR